MGLHFQNPLIQQSAMVCWGALCTLHPAKPWCAVINEGLPVGSKCPTGTLLLTCLPSDGGAQSVGDPWGHLQGHSDLIIPKKRTEDRLLNVRLLITACFYKHLDLILKTVGNRLVSGRHACLASERDLFCQHCHGGVRWAKMETGS